MTVHRIALFLLAAFVLVAIAATDITAALARLRRAQRLLNYVTAVDSFSQFRLQGASGKVDNAINIIKTSKEAGGKATLEMRKFEEEIELAQGDKSDYAKALDDAEAATTAFKSLREKIESSAQYREAQEGAFAGKKKTEELSDIQQRFFKSNPDYIRAQSASELMVSRFQAIRQELFTADARWQAAAQAARNARIQASDAKKHLQGGMITKMSAADDARKAAAAKRAAENLLKLRENQAGVKPSTPSSSDRK